MNYLVFKKNKNMNFKKISIALGFSLGAILSFEMISIASARQPLDSFEGHPPIHIRTVDAHGQLLNHQVPNGLSPAQIKNVYNLPATGGTGTIAIIDAYDDPNIQTDLNTFSNQYHLPTANFEKHLMAPRVKNDAGWALEESLDTQWAHAIAPNAKILLVVAKSASGNDLMAAVDYARNRQDVVAISMSWGGSEFLGESSYDPHFISPYGAAFFASSGDSGAGVSWPAVSPNVIGVGGTKLNFVNSILSSETAWSGSGGGLSKYETQPGYQNLYNVAMANGMRAVPDVSYNADPASGVSVYDSFGYQGIRGWFVVGGTSAGAPQWAAIKALNATTTNTNIYQDALAAPAAYFRDIVTGSNGTCEFYCSAQAQYDYVTGLGSPITIGF